MTRRNLAALAAVVTVMGSGFAHAAGRDKVTVRDDGQQARLLANVVCTQIMERPNASADQYEAMIIFALSQSEDPNAVQLRALEELPRICALNGGAVAALANARSAALRGAATGTAGLTTGRGLLGTGTGGFGPNVFSAPAVNVGGGSSNYRTGTN